jgi:GWxTD domain-containing protein
MRLLNLAVRRPFSEALSWTLFHSLWEGILIAVALAALLPLVRSPRVRYLAGCVALFAMLASIAITLMQFLPGSDSNARTLIKAALPPLRELPAANESGRHFPDFVTLIPWLAPAWLIGVCFFYLRYALSWLSSYRLRRRAVCSAPDSWQRAVMRLASQLKLSRPVVLLESLLADTPVVLGHFRPVVLVPLGFLTGLPPDHVEAVLLHELAHISRSDYLINVCQRLIEGLLFYHPAVWWISRVIRTERENCCDDIVVMLKGDARGYADALTALERNRLEQQWPMRQQAVAATGGNLMKRVKRLLYPKGPAGIWAPALAALVLLASTAMALVAWQLNPNPASQQTDNQLNSPWQKWLNEEVVYIISEQEKTAFEALNTDEERQHFVEQFWARRDPTPGTPENEFKKEHYRRIAYANAHYTRHPPGWKTDRGRIYILYGPPDEIDSHPSGGTYERPASEGGGSALTYPFEDWRYSHFENTGSMTIEFVDPTMSGEFRMTLDPNEKYKKP